MPLRYNSSSTFTRPSAPRGIDLGHAPGPGHHASPHPHHHHQQRPQLPISPPDTQVNTPATADAKSLVDPILASDESPADRFRRVTSLAYNHARGPSRSLEIKPTRWLVVVLPPSTLNSEPVLGHTLSTAPPGRFTTGILMPLFPTLYGQLSAIAKEFGLPSTSGVCVYLHLNEGGRSMSPRISDESWQLLWGHHFIPDEHAPVYPSHRLPIGGQIEFDIDARKARWYDSWIGHSRDNEVDMSIAPSVHWKADNHVPHIHHDIAPDEHEPIEDGMMGRRRHVPRPLALLGRREGSISSLPRFKLAADNQSVVSRGYAGRPAPLSPVEQADEPQTARNNLDTLVRNWRATTPMASRMAPTVNGLPDAPDTMESEMDLADYQWSISSAGPPENWPASPVWSRGAPSIHITGRMRGSVVMTPSVATTFGNIDNVPETPKSNVSRLPSPDLAYRCLSDAPVTPTTATSWGPPLSWPSSPADVSRAVSPDIAARGNFSTPGTPLTATSWGAPDVWPASPMDHSRAHTPDIGHRAHWSAPATPTTATSWGAPDEFPPSPLAVSRVHTPDMGIRGYDGMLEFRPPPRYVHVWPRNVQQSATPQVEILAPVPRVATPRLLAPLLNLPSPPHEQTAAYNDNHEDVPLLRPAPPPRPKSSAGRRSAAPSPVAVPESSSTAGSISARIVAQTLSLGAQQEPSMGHIVTQAMQGAKNKAAKSQIPARQLQPTSPYDQVWPRNSERIELAVTRQQAVQDEYQQVWPRNATSISQSLPFDNVWPRNASSIAGGMATQEAEITRYEHVWPRNVESKYEHVWPRNSARIANAQADGDKYEHVWPRNVKPDQAIGDKYMHVWPRNAKKEAKPASRHGRSHPPRATVAAVIPTAVDHQLATFLDRDEVVVPLLSAPPPPRPRSAIGRKTPSPSPQPQKQDIKILADGISSRIVAGEFGNGPREAGMPDIVVQVMQNVNQASPTLEVFTQVRKGVCGPVRLAPQYPGIDLYCSQYPYLDIYPPLPRSEKPKAQTVSLQKSGFEYPNLVVYPAVYPNVAPYASSVTMSKEVQKAPKIVSLSVRLPRSYPNLEIYTPQYPFVSMYSQQTVEIQQAKVQSVYLQGSSSSNYPKLSVYPENGSGVQYARPLPKSAAYPLYSPVREIGHPKTRPTKLAGLRYDYPNIVIYPPVHKPKLELQRAAALSSKKTAIHSSGSYPSFNLYPAVYPHLEIYPHSHQRTVFNAPRYDYPNITIYPNASGSSAHDVSIPRNQSVRLAKNYPQFDLYTPQYPHLEIYPAVLKASTFIPPVFNYPHIVIYPSITKKLPLISSTVSTTRNLTSVTRFSAFKAPVYDYPNIVVYPGVSGGSRAALWVPVTKSLPVKLLRQYPQIDIYTPQYPHLEIYPAVERPSAFIPPVYKYPFIVIYPARDSIMPSTVSKAIGLRSTVYQRHSAATITGPSFSRLPGIYARQYPNLEIYPPNANYSVFKAPAYSYPDIVIYPTVQGSVATRSVNTLLAPFKRALSIRLPRHYPELDLYAPHYPHLEIYPRVPRSSVFLAPVYSYPNIVVYPAKDTVRALDTSLTSIRKTCTVKLPKHYPEIDLYAPQYPHLEIYPPAHNASPFVPPAFNYPFIVIYPTKETIVDAIRTPTPRPVNAVRTPKFYYPFLEIYSPVYPHLCLYPPKIVITSRGSPADWSGPRLPALYPALQIYEAVYPFFDIYPVTTGRYEAPGAHASVPEQRRRPRKTHLMLHNEVMGRLQSKPAPAPAPAPVHPAPVRASPATPSYVPRKKQLKAHLELHNAYFTSRPTPRPRPPIASAAAAVSPVPDLRSALRRPTARTANAPPMPTLPTRSSTMYLPNSARVPSVMERVRSLHIPEDNEDVLAPLSGPSTRRSTKIDNNTSPTASSPSALSRARSLKNARVDEAPPLRSGGGATSKVPSRPRGNSILISDKTRLFNAADSDAAHHPSQQRDEPPSRVNRPISKLDRSKFPFA